MSAKHGAGVGLLYDVLGALANHGYTKTRVDEYHHPDGTRVRHHFSGGEWTLVITRPDGRYQSIKWSVHRDMPAAAEVVAQVTDNQLVTTATEVSK